MKIKTLLLSLLFAFGLLLNSPVHAQSKSRKHNTTKRYSKKRSSKKRSSTKEYKSTRPKTVHVRSYTKKNGTRVASYKRAAPIRK